MFKVAFDLDNTIVDYSELFSKIAGLYNVPLEHRGSKTEIRNYFIRNNQEEIWTVIQGRVYGLYMINARIFDGFVPSIMKLSSKISAWKIISHRGRMAHSGEKIDMHKPARQFVSRYLADVQNQNFKGLELVETLEDKIQRINDFKPFLIVDDLPRVLEHEKLRSSIIRMQFMAGRSVSNKMSNGNIFLKDWQKFPKLFEEVTR